MDQDRRSRDRCSVCQGPTKVGADGSIRCRNSLCSFNHQNQTCPRCKHVGPDVVGGKGDGYTYCCPECLNKWSA